jgi:putative transcriptional regulator
MIKPGTLLVAHPKFTQGIFARSVVLITEHHSDGTNGFIINKPLQHTMRELVEGLEFEQSLGQIVYHGGPVNPRAICMLHSDTWYTAKTIHVCNGVSLSNDRMMLKKINMGNTPLEYRFFLGMSSWYAGQLQSELTHDNMARHPLWLTTSLKNSKLLFSANTSSMWEQCLDLCASEITSQYF